MRVAAVIPAFNEAPTIEGVVAAARAAGLDAIVVDDGSADATSAGAARAGAKVVLRHERNRGKGAALATGFRAALAAGYDGAIVVDADGQHDPREAERFVECAGRTGAGLVIGTRMRRRRGMPFVRWATNALMSNLLSMISGVRLSDTQCGMKLLTRVTLETLVSEPFGSCMSAAAHFDVESEIVLACASAGIPICEVPIRTIYVAGRRSRIRPGRDTLRFFRLVLRHIARRGDISRGL